MLRPSKKQPACWLWRFRLGRFLPVVTGTTAALILLGQPASASAETIKPPEHRLALVVGNASYVNIGKVDNAEADARAVAKELSNLGFEVMEGYNLDRRALLEIVSRFADRLPDVNVAVFYFSGQGAQQRGRNFILPTGIKFEGEDDLAGSTVPVASIAMRMSSMNRAAFDLLIIDACRENPFQGSGNASVRSPGLAAPEASGVMVLQAAGANQPALDRLGPDDQDPNGVFTRELLKAMREPGVPIRKMAIRLQDAVEHDAASIGRTQTPAFFDEASGDFTFTPGAAPQAPQPAAPAKPDPASSTVISDAPVSVPAPGPLVQEQLAGLRNTGAPVTANPAAARPSPSPQEPEAALGLDARKRTLAQLHQLGFYDGVADGEFGSSARTAIRQFQAFQGLPETGILSETDRAALAAQSEALSALLAVADHSPRNVAASTIPGAEDRRRRAWKLENPASGQRADLVEAAYWYALAGGQGNRLALLALGNMKIRGKGIAAPDPAAAQLLWRAAAARGEPSAFYNLGILAERGDGAQPDRAAALRWYRRAANLHFAEASQSLRRLQQ